LYIVTLQRSFTILGTSHNDKCFGKNVLSLSVKKNFVVADRHLSVSPVHLISVSTHKSAHEVTIINSTAVPFLYAKEPNGLVFTVLKRIGEAYK
jgi:hypothetical protein